MKFVKGMIAGMVITVGATMMCNEFQGSYKPNKMLKQGKRMMKKIGIM